MSNLNENELFMSSAVYAEAQAAVEHITYGYAVYETGEIQSEEFFPLQTSAEYAVPVEASLSFYPGIFEGAETEIPTVYDSESDFFDGLIEILAEETDLTFTENQTNNFAFTTASPVAMPILPFSDEGVEMDYICQAYPYNLPEALCVDEEKKLMALGYIPVDYVQAFESIKVSEERNCKSSDIPMAYTEMGDMSNMKYHADFDDKVVENVQTHVNYLHAFHSIAMEEHVFAGGEVDEVHEKMFEVGVIDVDYLKTLSQTSHIGSDEKKLRRHEAINRWRMKKSKIKHSIKNMNATITDAASACCSLLSARQKATAKRQRENGKFRKAQVKWVPVTDLFSSLSDENFKGTG